MSMLIKPASEGMCSVFTLIVNAYLFLLFTVGCNERERADYDKVKKELMDLERTCIEQENKADTAFLSSVMDSTFIELDSGRIVRKHDVLKEMYYYYEKDRQKATPIDSFKLEDEVVHIYEKSAVVSFIMHTYRTRNDSLVERYKRFYDSWIKRDGQWKAIAWQGYHIREVKTAMFK